MEDPELSKTRAMADNPPKYPEYGAMLDEYDKPGIPEVGEVAVIDFDGENPRYYECTTVDWNRDDDVVYVTYSRRLTKQELAKQESLKRHPSARALINPIPAGPDRHA